MVPWADVSSVHVPRTRMVHLPPSPPKSLRRTLSTECSKAIRRPNYYSTLRWNHTRPALDFPATDPTLPPREDSDLRVVTIEDFDTLLLTLDSEIGITVASPPLYYIFRSSLNISVTIKLEGIILPPHASIYFTSLRQQDSSNSSIITTEKEAKDCAKMKSSNMPSSSVSVSESLGG